MIYNEKDASPKEHALEAIRKMKVQNPKEDPLVYDIEKMVRLNDLKIRELLAGIHHGEQISLSWDTINSLVIANDYLKKNYYLPSDCTNDYTVNHWGGEYKPGIKVEKLENQAFRAEMKRVLELSVHEEMAYELKNFLGMDGVLINKITSNDDLEEIFAECFLNDEKSNGL